MAVRIYQDHPPTCLDRDVRHPDRLPFYVTPSLITRLRRYGNINPFPISYAFQPRLRGRLTLRGLTFLRKPWIYGEQVSHLFYRYSCRHTHFHAVHPSLRSSFAPAWNAPLPVEMTVVIFQSTASVINFSPVTFSAQVHLISELLRFL